MSRRRTLARAASVRGFGLFTDAESAVEFQPAAPGAGVRVRSGLSETSALIDHVTARPVHPAFSRMPPRCTGLDLPAGAVIHTIEHVLSALAGLGVTDVTVCVEGPEAPIGDGSALAFVEAIDRAGLIDATDDQAPRLTRSVTVGELRGPRVEITPAERLSMTFHLDYGPGSPIARQSATWDGSPEGYRGGVAPARTYCLLHEAESMTSLGLFARLKPGDFLVIGPDGPVGNELRFADEPARHKLLDLIGDLALAGLPWPAMRVEAFGTGHALHHRAARALRSAVREGGTV